MPTLFSFYFRLLVLLTGLVGAGRVWQVTKPGSGAGNQALSSVAGRLAQDVYVWQRIWSSEVWTAVEAQRGLFRRVMPLAAELEIESGKRKSITVDVDWGRLAKLAPQIEPCIRLAAGAVEADEVWLAAVVKKLFPRRRERECALRDCN